MASLPKEARLSLGLTIDEAARKLGISAGYLSQIENGKRHITPQRAEQIAMIYGKSLEDIFFPSRFCRKERIERISN